MDGNWSPPSRGLHIFVVLRHDEYVRESDDSIAGTKAFLARDKAEAEAARLNDLNAHTGARYFVRVARLQDDFGPDET